MTNPADLDNIDAMAIAAAPVECRPQVMAAILVGRGVSGVRVVGYNVMVGESLRIAFYSRPLTLLEETTGAVHRAGSTQESYAAAIRSARIHEVASKKKGITIADDVLAHRDRDHAAVEKLEAHPAVRDWKALNPEDRIRAYTIAHALVKRWADGGSHEGMQDAGALHHTASPAVHEYLRKHALPEGSNTIKVYAGQGDAFKRLGIGATGELRGKPIDGVTQPAAINWSTKPEVANVFAHRATVGNGRGVVVHAEIPAEQTIAHMNTLRHNVYLPLTAYVNHALPQRSGVLAWFPTVPHDKAIKMMSARDKAAGFQPPAEVKDLPKFGDGHKLDDPVEDEYGWESEIITKPGIKAKVVTVHEKGVAHHADRSEPYASEPDLQKLAEAKSAQAKHRGEHLGDFVADSFGTPIEKIVAARSA